MHYSKTFLVLAKLFRELQFKLVFTLQLLNRNWYLIKQGIIFQQVYCFISSASFSNAYKEYNLL